MISQTPVMYCERSGQLHSPSLHFPILLHRRLTSHAFSVFLSFFVSILFLRSGGAWDIASYRATMCRSETKELSQAFAPAPYHGKSLSIGRSFFGMRSQNHFIRFMRR